jgi:hypothetical protein
MAREKLKGIVACEKRNALSGDVREQKLTVMLLRKINLFLTYCMENHEKEKADGKTDTAWVHQIYLGWCGNGWRLAWSVVRPVTFGRGCTGEKARGSHRYADGGTRRVYS